MGSSFSSVPISCDCWCKECSTQAHPAFTATSREKHRLWGAQESIELSVFAGTWNVGGEMPPWNLHEWLHSSTHVDIYLLAVQECMYAAPEGFSSYLEHWYFCVEDCLPDHQVFCKRSMWQMNVIGLASRDVISNISGVESSKEETGVLHVIPNKGAVGLSFTIGDTSMCFVGAHLAANHDKMERRASDIGEIIWGIRLGVHGTPLTNQFTHVIWAGDLNYRIDMEREECERLVQERQLATLLEHDQLRKAQREEHVLYMFEEGPIEFAPTYKHVAGEPPDPTTGVRAFDQKKPRVPGWCDRILWRSFPGVDLQLVPGSYTSVPAVCSSDHSPVRCLFRMQVPRPLDISTQGEVISTPSPSVTIVVDELRAEGLGESRPGPRGPHVVITSRFISSPFTTQAGSEHNDPVWHQEARLQPLDGYDDLGWLMGQHLLVSVHKNTYIGTDRPVGFGVIPLKGADSGAKFITRLSCDGRPAGTLSGRVSVVGS